MNPAGIGSSSAAARAGVADAVARGRPLQGEGRTVLLLSEVYMLAIDFACWAVISCSSQRQHDVWSGAADHCSRSPTTAAVAHYQEEGVRRVSGEFILPRFIRIRSCFDEVSQRRHGHGGTDAGSSPLQRQKHRLEKALSSSPSPWHPVCAAGVVYCRFGVRVPVGYRGVLAALHKHRYIALNPAFLCINTGLSRRIRRLHWF